METWRNDGSLQLEPEQHTIRAPVLSSERGLGQDRPCASRGLVEVWHALDSCGLEGELREIGYRIFVLLKRLSQEASGRSSTRFSHIIH